MAIQQLMLGTGAGGDSYWIKSLRFDYNANIDMRGNGTTGSVVSPDGTDDGNMYIVTGQQSQGYPNNKDGNHMIKFDKDGTVLAKQSYFYAMGDHAWHVSMDPQENLYVGMQSGRMIKFNSSFVEQVKLDIDKTSWNNSRPFIFEGDYIHMMGVDNGYDNSAHGRTYYRKMSKSTLEPQTFGGSYDTKGIWKQGNTGPWLLKDSKFYMIQPGVTVSNSSYHDVLCKFDYTSSSWNDSGYPFHMSNDLDWIRRLSKQDGTTGHSLSVHTCCLTVDDDGNVYTAGKNSQVGNSNPEYGSRNQLSKLNSSGTTQWFMNIERSADGDGIYNWGDSYSGGGGPVDIKVIGNYVYTLNEGKNNTQTNKSGFVKDITIAKMNKSDGAYQSSYSIANETRNFTWHTKAAASMYGALWTDTAVYFTLNGQFSTTNEYEGDRTFILKLPIDGGVNGTYTLDGQTIKISGNSLSQGTTSTSGKTWTSSGSNLGDSKNGRSNVSTSSVPSITTHSASYTNTQLDL